MDFVFTFSLLLPVSFATPELFLMLVYFLLHMRPPSYSTCILLTWFSIFWGFFFFVLFDFSFDNVWNYRMHTWIWILNVVSHHSPYMSFSPLSLIHLHGLAPGWPLFSSFRWKNCFLERFSFSLHVALISLLTMGPPSSFFFLAPT